MTIIKNQTQLLTAGATGEAAAKAAGHAVTFSRVSVGDANGVLPPFDLSRTALDNHVKDGAILSHTVDENNADQRKLVLRIAPDFNYGARELLVYATANGVEFPHTYIRLGSVYPIRTADNDGIQVTIETYIKVSSETTFDIKVLPGTDFIARGEFDAHNHDNDYLGKETKAEDIGAVPASSFTETLKYIRELGPNENLNNITTTGIYTQASNAQAETGTNYPPRKVAGMLTVINRGSITTQSYQTYDGQGVWERARYAHLWRDWVKPVYTNSDNSNRIKADGISPLEAGNYTSGSALEIYSDSPNDAYMSFHVGGDFALNFGLDSSTNLLTVGGGSMGVGKSYPIYHKGYKPTHKDVTAERLIDLNVTTTDYIKRVVLLHEYNTNTNDGAQHYFVGELKGQRVNQGTFPTCIINSGNQYSTAEPTATLLKVGEDQWGCKLVTLTYGGKKWLGMYWYAAPAIYWLSMAGKWNGALAGTVIDYYNTQTSTALNSEVNNSIADYSSVGSKITLENNELYHKGNLTPEKINTYSKPEIDTQNGCFEIKTANEMAKTQGTLHVFLTNSDLQIPDDIGNKFQFMVAKSVNLTNANTCQLLAPIGKKIDLDGMGDLVDIANIVEKGVIHTALKINGVWTL